MGNAGAQVDAIEGLRIGRSEVCTIHLESVVGPECTTRIAIGEWHVAEDTHGQLPVLAFGGHGHRQVRLKGSSLVHRHAPEVVLGDASHVHVEQRGGVGCNETRGEEQAREQESDDSHGVIFWRATGTRLGEGAGEDQPRDPRVD